MNEITLIFPHQLFRNHPAIDKSRKMSNFLKGDWCDIWDSLFWRFIYKHKKVFEKNPRMSMMVVRLNRMEKEKLKRHLKRADSFLKKLFNND